MANLCAAWRREIYAFAAFLTLRAQPKTSWSPVGSIYTLAAQSFNGRC
jgi:hypothetical protein